MYLQREKEEQDYLDAVKKAYDLKEALDKLSSENKNKFFYEVLGGNVSVELINQAMTNMRRWR